MDDKELNINDLIIDTRKMFEEQGQTNEITPDLKIVNFDQGTPLYKIPKHDAATYKLVVISDVHHDTDRLSNIIPVINSADYLIFCGDCVSDIMNIYELLTVPVVCVRGNNDFKVNAPENACFVLGNVRVMVTHGHKHNVRQGVHDLKSAAKKQNCGLVFYGHTHQYEDKIIDGIHFINPGALCDGTYALVAGCGNNFRSKMCKV